VFVYKYNGATATLLSESDDVFLYDPSSVNQYIASVVFPATTILATDRIYIELRGKATANNIHVSLHFGDSTPSHAHTTIPSVSGTGVVKVVNGVFQTPANLIFDADVNAAAAIAQSKIANLTSDLAGKVTSVTGTSPIVSSGGTTPTISIPVATATTSGYLASADWTTFNSKQAAGNYLTSITANAPILSTGGTAPTISIPVATAATSGYLSSTDWTTFNAKQPAGAYVTSITSGITGSTQLSNMIQITNAGYSAITPLSNTLYIIVG
jgi:hypothetical protein